MGMVKLKHLHYGWIIAVIACVILISHGLIIYTFGIFLRPLTIEFGWERGALSLALSMALLVTGGFGIIAGRLSDKYGPRPLLTASGILIGISFFLLSQISSLWQVYLIWGLLLSVAMGCGFVPVTSTIPRWFIKRGGIAMGITFTGFGLGGVISPPLAQWLIETYDWRQAYIILGLITFIIVTLLSQFMKHSPQRIGQKPYGENGTVEDKQTEPSTPDALTFKQAIKTWHFWIFGILIFSFTFVIQVVIVHIVPHAIDIGISASIAASIVSILAATSLIGRNLVGFVSDKIGVRQAISVSLVIVVLALIWLFFSGDIWMFYLFAVFYGIAYGGVTPLEVLLTGELFGLKFLGMILASLIFFGTVGGAAGPPLAGYIFDITGSYNLAFIICIILGTLAVVLSLIILRSRIGVSVAK
jgi:MFS family permease